MESLLAADACAPEPLIDGVFHLLIVGLDAVLAQIVDFILAGEGHVAGRGDDFNLGSEYLECQVEAHLVVAGTCRTVCHGVGTDFLGIFDDGDGLEDAFG